MRRPVPVAVAAAALLVVLGLPFLRHPVHGRRRVRAAREGERRASSTTALTARLPGDVRDARLRGRPRQRTSAGAYARAVRALPEAALVRAARQIGPRVWEVAASSGKPFLAARRSASCARCARSPAARSWAERRRSSSTRSTRSARTSRSPSRLLCADDVRAALSRDALAGAAVEGAADERADAVGDVRASSSSSSRTAASKDCSTIAARARCS